MMKVLTRAMRPKCSLSSNRVTTRLEGKRTVFPPPMLKTVQAAPAATLRLRWPLSAVGATAGSLGAPFTPLLHRPHNCPPANATGQSSPEGPMAKDHDVCSEQRVGHRVRDDGVRNPAASVLRNRVDHPSEDACEPTSV